MDESSSQKSEQVSVPWQWNSRPRPSAPGLLAETALGSRLGAADGRAGHGELDLHGLGQGEHLWRYKSSLSCWKDRKVVGTSSRWVGGASTGSRSHLAAPLYRRKYPEGGPTAVVGRIDSPEGTEGGGNHHAGIMQRDTAARKGTGGSGKRTSCLLSPRRMRVPPPAAPPRRELMTTHPAPRAAGSSLVACQLSGLCLPSVLFGGGCS